MGELVWGGSLPVAFGFSDRLQVTHDTLQYTRSKGKPKKVFNITVFRSSVDTIFTTLNRNLIKVAKNMQLLDVF